MNLSARITHDEYFTDSDELEISKMRLYAIVKKADESYKAVLGHRRTLDKKTLKSLVQSKPSTKTSKGKVEYVYPEWSL